VTLGQEGGVPTTVEAVLAFAVFIFPGFLLRRGYVRTRTRGSIEVDLYGLAEAVVGSLFILAIAWWWKGSDVFGWAARGELAKHQTQTYEFFLALPLVPFPLGLALGWVVMGALRLINRLRPQRGSRSRLARFYFLDIGGILTLPTVWDQAWNDIGRLGAALARVRTTTGNEVVGTVERGAWVGLSPEPRDIYLRRVYRETPRADGSLFRTRKESCSMPQRSNQSNSSGPQAPPGSAAVQRGKLTGTTSVPPTVTIGQARQSGSDKSQ
jgi:Family of unknown function (DUF6338)